MARNKKGSVYDVERQLAEGEICDIFLARAANLVRKERWEDDLVVLKVAADKDQNVYVEHEAATIRHLHDGVKASGIPDGMLWKLSWLLDSYTDDTGVSVNVMKYATGYYTLEEIRYMYPEGVPPDHVAWMFNRMLEAITVAHEVGVVHGAVLPCHMLIRSGDESDPLRHSGILIDWCYAVHQGQHGVWPHLTSMSEQYEAFYPPEVHRREPATPATDIFMAASCAIYLLGGEVTTGWVPESTPWQMGRIFREYCRHNNPGARPRDAWVLRREFMAMLRQVYGPRTFVHLPIPPRS